MLYNIRTALVDTSGYFHRQVPHLLRNAIQLYFDAICTATTTHASSQFASAQIPGIRCALRWSTLHTHTHASRPLCAKNFADGRTDPKRYPRHARTHTHTRAHVIRETISERAFAHVWVCVYFGGGHRGVFRTSSTLILMALICDVTVHSTQQ